MKNIVPIIVTEDILTSTNVHEIAPALYDPGMTYAKGDFRHVVNGIKLDIYESLKDENAGNTPEPSPEWWVFRSYTYPEYDPLVTYAKDDIVIVAADHKKYKSLQAGNIENTPTGTSIDLYWSIPSATAPWSPFDVKIGSQVERTGSIEYTLTPGNIVSGISFFKLEASSIDITMTDPVEGVVYEKSVSLISTSNVFDAYSYRFAPFLMTRHTVETDLPPYRNAVLSIKINAESDTATAKCGEIVFGAVQYSGVTEYSPSLEIVNYSDITPDLWGNLEVVERSFTKKTNVEMTIDNSILQSVFEFLETYRATPVVWIPTEIETIKGPYLTYGYYKRATTVFEYLEDSIINVELIGMTMT